jgi:hypothetical protein
MNKDKRNHLFLVPSKINRNILPGDERAIDNDDDGYVIVDATLSKPLECLEPDDYLIEYYIGASYHEDQDKITPICEARIVILDPWMPECPLREACDAKSEDLIDAYENIFDENEDLIPPLNEHEGPVCYLDEFIVEEQFRHYREDLLKWIISFLTKDCSAIVVLPAPSSFERKDNIIKIQRSNDPAQKQELRNFYTSMGFFPLRDTDYMYQFLISSE